MSQTAPHRRQFVLGPEPVRTAGGWAHDPVPGFGHLSRCPELRARRAGDRDGVAWWLLGSAWARPSPVEQIARAATAEVPRLYRRWSGRWVLVGGGEVHMDAAGLLGCFYKDGRVSSSAALLAGDERPALPPLDYQRGLDWYPLPLARFASLRRLLPGQVLHAGGRVSARPLLVDAAPRDYEAILGEVEGLLVDAVRSAAEDGPLHVPLTAGYDSRLVLAATRAASVTARAYTQGYPGMTRGDRELPAMLARAAGCEHAFIEPGPFDAERARLFDAHTSGHCVDRDREFFARGQWDWCREGDVIARGGCFEVGRIGFRPEIGERPFGLEAIERPFPAQHPEARDALAGWMAWCREHEERLDWRDRFYWEQRLGGWLSAVEQGLDLVAAERGHVANSSRFYELVLALPEEAQRTSRHHVDLIRRLAPGLLELPFNPLDPFPLRVKRKAVRTLKGLYQRLLSGPRAARRAGTA